MEDKAVNPPGAEKTKTTPLKQARGTANMVQTPPRATEQVNIELEDLRELARINPVAWEQLLHIVDNRQNNERIADLEAHLEKAHEVAGNGSVAKQNFPFYDEEHTSET